MLTRHVSAAVFALALVPLSATAWNGHAPTRIVGQYFLSDDDLALAGGAVLYSDCTHDGTVIGAAIPAGPPPTPPFVGKLTATYWVNDPDPADYPRWTVPDELRDKRKLLLCYNIEQIDVEPPVAHGEFCDWAPRDLKRPLEIYFAGDDPDPEVRDILISVIYQGGPRLCADR